MILELLEPILHTLFIFCFDLYLPMCEHIGDTITVPFLSTDYAT